jgi:murein DD-endopeptidase MepM/ murein hydrolase activator NlpD
LIASVAVARGVTIKPSIVLQGQTVEVTAAGNAISARLDGRTFKLFPGADGNATGLVAAPAELAPGAYRLEVLDVAGAVIDSAEVTVRDARFPVQNIRLGRAQAELKPSPGEMETVAALRETITDIRQWDKPFARPVPGCMTSPFGVQRWHNGKPTGSYHRGIDQRSPKGTPIRAVAAGTVRIVQMFNIHGGTVGIDHGHGFTSIYLHMSDFAAREGAIVKKGDVIGYAGSTGRSTAPHLHWGMNVQGIAVNPAQFIDLEPCGAPKRSVRCRSVRNVQ